MNRPRPATAAGVPLNASRTGRLSQLQAAIAGQQANFAGQRNAAISAVIQPDPAQTIQPAQAIQPDQASQPAQTFIPARARDKPIKQAWMIIKEVIMANAPAGEEIIVRHAFGGGSTQADTAGNEQVIDFLEAHGPGSIADSAPAAAAGLMAAARAFVIHMKQLPQDAEAVADIISPAGLEHYTKIWTDAIEWAKYQAADKSLAYALGSAPEAYEQTAFNADNPGDYVIALSLVTLMSIVSQQAPPAAVRVVETVTVNTQPAVWAIIAQANDTQAHARTISERDLAAIVRQNGHLASSIGNLPGLIEELIGETEETEEIEGVAPQDPAAIYATFDDEDGLVLGDLREAIAENASDINEFNAFVEAAHNGESIRIQSGELAGEIVARRWNFRGLPATPAGIAAMARAFAEIADNESIAQASESIARAAILARRGPFEITAVLPVFATTGLALAIASRAIDLLPPPAGGSFEEVIEQTALDEDGLSSAISSKEPSVFVEADFIGEIGSPIRAYSLGVVPGAERTIAALMDLAGIEPSADSIDEVADRIAAGANPSADSAQQALAAIAAQMSVNIGPVSDDMRGAQEDISLAELAQAAGFLPEYRRQDVRERITELRSHGATEANSAELKVLTTVTFR